MLNARVGKLSLVLTLASFIVEGSSNQVRYRARADMRHKADAVLLETQAPSLATCTTHCTRNSTCNSVSFRSSDGTCYTSSNRTMDDRGSSYISSFIPKALEVEVGWTTMSKIEYPVVHLVGPHTLTYQLKFPDAVNVCASYGTAIAAPELLLTARDLGYHFCACSWLANGKNGFVLQKPNSSCWPSYKTTIIYCGRRKANVFCES